MLYIPEKDELVCIEDKPPKQALEGAAMNLVIKIKEKVMYRFPYDVYYIGEL